MPQFQTHQMTKSPFKDRKGLGLDKGIIETAARWLAERWTQLEERYGRRVALGMAVAGLATFPIPGNVTAIIAAAEAIRAIHGWASKSMTEEDWLEGLARTVLMGKGGDCLLCQSTLVAGEKYVCMGCNDTSEKAIGISHSRFMLQGLVSEFRSFMERLRSFGIRVPSLSDEQIARTLERAMNEADRIEFGRKSTKALMEPTDRQMRIAEGMTTQQLNQARMDNERRLQEMSRSDPEAYHGESGDVAVRWRTAIDRVLYRREGKGLIPGGLSEGKQPEDFDPNQLAAGIKVEMEHTTDRNIAQEIAMDHLTEDPNYYQKLKQVEGNRLAVQEAKGFETWYTEKHAFHMMKRSPFMKRKGLNLLTKDGWITIGSRDGEGGAHVYLEDGKIRKGPKEVANKPIAEVDQNKEPGTSGGPKEKPKEESKPDKPKETEAEGRVDKVTGRLRNAIQRVRELNRTMLAGMSEEEKEKWRTDFQQSVNEKHEAEKEIRSYMNENAPKLDEKQKKVLTEYAGDMVYKKLNSGLRNGKLSAQQKQFVETMDSLIDANTLPEKTVAYRGVGNLKAFGADPSKLVGKVFKDKAFMSTSLNESVAQEFDGAAIVEIDLPKGTKGVMLPEGEYEEAEVLLGRGSKLKVVSAEKEGKRWRIKMSVAA